MIAKIKQNLINIELIILTIVLAFCSIVYELLLSNTLAIVTGDFVWWQSLTVGIFIGGLGLGAYLSNHLKRPLKSLLNVELALSIMGMFCVIYIYFLHAGYKYVDNLFFYTSDFHAAFYHQNLFILKIFFFVCAQIITLFIGVASGFEIPLVMRLVKERNPNKEEDYIIYGFNYIGTLLGTMALSYYFIPKFDVVLTSVIVAGLNLLVCIYLCLRLFDKIQWKPLIIACLLGLCGIYIGLKETNITQSYLKVFYYVPKILSDSDQRLDSIIAKIKKLPEIERYKSLYQYLDIITYPEKVGDQKINSTILTLDNNFQFSTATEYFYHQGFAHISIMLNGEIPKNVLILGGGDGLLARELVKYDEIESIDLIELDEKMIEFANTKFKKQNSDSLENSKVNWQINDGFYYIRNTKKKYDAIYIDFPYPNSYDLARLYSVEFYRYVLARLNPNGFVVLDAPLYGSESVLKEKNNSNVGLRSISFDHHALSNNVLASTFYYAGFKTFLPYSIGDESFAFLKNKAGEVNQNFMNQASRKFLSKDVDFEAQKIPSQHYNYQIALKYVNSIFKPIIVKKN